MADFYDRVKLLMRHYKVNKREFVNNCDISYGTLSGSKSRYNDPQLKTIRKILRAYPAVREAVSSGRIEPHPCFGLRPETLSVAQFVELTRWVADLLPASDSATLTE